MKFVLTTLASTLALAAENNLYDEFLHNLDYNPPVAGEEYCYALAMSGGF
jgi:hypothetical protein